MDRQSLVDLGETAAWCLSAATDTSGELQTHSLGVPFMLGAGAAPHVGLWKAPKGTYKSSGIPYAETFIVRNGSANVTIGGEVFKLEAGSVFVLPADKEFEFEVVEDFCKFTVTSR